MAYLGDYTVEEAAQLYLDKLKLDQRIAVITGGAQGIGLACAEAIAEAGATVILADINSEKATGSAAELTKRGFDAHAHKLDVTDSNAVATLASQLVETFGRVDILINNAGIAHSNVKAEDTSDDHWRLHMNVNVDGLFWCCREFGKLMLAQGKGSIVNIGSISGVIVNIPQEQAFYNASKAAVHQLTKSLAGEWAQHGIRVNAVAPSYIETDILRQVAKSEPEMVDVWTEMTPMKRLGQTHEVASVVHFLASDAASLMTGSVVLCDGGYVCW